MPTLAVAASLLLAAPPLVAAPSAGSEPTENLLAPGGGDTENLLAPESASSEEAADESFGLALSALNLEATWSGYGDLIFSYVADGGSRYDDKSSFDASHFNPIVSARIGAKLRAELELEVEHAGEQIKVEYGFAEYAFAEPFTLRMGHFLVPIGRFNDVLHPSFRWNQISRPSMFRDVVPAVWSEVGVQAYGTLRASPSFVFEYALYVVNGLGGDLDGALAEEKEPIRALRGNTRDNNTDKAVGGRLTLSLFEGQQIGKTKLGLSGYTGIADPNDSRRISIFDVDLSVSLGPLLLRGEFAQSYLATGGEALSSFEQGSYLQLAWQGEQIRPALRWDYTRLAWPSRSSTKPLDIHTVVPSLMYAPDVFWSVRVEVQVPFDEAWERGDEITLATMLAFSF